ncbi:MAG TPA: response regulator transcription factor [Bryobacteraceae bacterium]|jgi:DNA-binding NarL/FixJ family response regulator|nr:response regulator transcription factor [Bryobacteraceae bacterium]
MSSQGPIRVLICNRYTLFREGIRALLGEGIPMDVVAEACTAGEAILMVERLHPDVVLLDATTPDASGSESTRRMKAVDPEVSVVILSMNDDEILRQRCLEAGADGFVSKEDQAWHLKRIINNVCGRHTRTA